jgi:transposase
MPWTVADTTRRYIYWKKENIFNVTDNPEPPDENNGGYHDLEALKRLKGDTDQCSMEDKVIRAGNLAVDLAYDGDKVRDTAALFGEENSNLIWVWVDGLAQRRLEKLIHGECSLQASIDFDPQEEERKVDEIIVKFLAMQLPAKAE